MNRRRLASWGFVFASRTNEGRRPLDAGAGSSGHDDIAERIEEILSSG